ncbi:MAG: hypothetical protein DRI81_18730 [Chloroflexi bacterium]|nr:MAG: hypothetical protein DRI81_18730 [Chloroflexota bacterium]
MTLVITELSQFGIAMVADSAVTCTEIPPSGQPIQRVLNGALKLQVIPYLNAGVSVWGLGVLPTATGQVSTDIWLSDFIVQHSGIATLDEFANTLAAELQTVAGQVQEVLGFHLAGYVDVDGQRLPTFYHVRNCDGTFRHYELHEFIPGQDFPPQELGDRIYRTRNGDYGPYAILSAGVERVLPEIHADPNLNLTIPYPSLQGRIAYLTAWLRFVSELYASSRLLRTIGGSMAALGISFDGQLMYYPAL